MAESHYLGSRNLEEGTFGRGSRSALSPRSDVRRRDNSDLMAKCDKLLRQKIDHFLNSADGAKILDDQENSHHARPRRRMHLLIAPAEFVCMVSVEITSSCCACGRTVPAPFRAANRFSNCAGGFLRAADESAEHGGRLREPRSDRHRARRTRL